MEGMEDEKNNDITGMQPHILNAALSYMAVLVLLPLFSGATANPFVQFHVKQGIVLLILEIVAVIASYWLSYVGGVLFLLLLLTSLAGLFSALHEEKWYIPGIGHLADLFTI